MDNRSAVQYLSTCSQLHALYHSFPLTEPVTSAQFRSIVSITNCMDSGSRMRRNWKWWTVCNVLAIAPIVVDRFVDQPAIRKATSVCLLAAIGDRIVSIIIWILFPRRTNCCSEGRRLNRLTRHVPWPRVVRLAGPCVSGYLPYLQHVEELHVCGESVTSAAASELPSSLRMMCVLLSGQEAAPKLGALAAYLLIMLQLKEAVLLPDTLPTSPVTLVLRYNNDVLKLQEPTTAVQPIVAGVLPPQRQWPHIEWPRSLVDFALPPSLTKLQIDHLPSLPIPSNSLPPRLHTLQITANTLAPLTRLRVQRVGSESRQPFAPVELPQSLQRLIILAATRQAADELVPMAARHAALVVKCDSVTHKLGPVQWTEEIFNESRRMTNVPGN